MARPEFSNPKDVWHLFDLRPHLRGGNFNWISIYWCKISAGCLRKIKRLSNMWRHSQSLKHSSSMFDRNKIQLTSINNSSTFYDTFSIYLALLDTDFTERIIYQRNVKCYHTSESTFKLKLTDNLVYLLPPFLHGAR